MHVPFLKIYVDTNKDKKIISKNQSRCIKVMSVMRLFNLVTNYTWCRASPMLHIPLNTHLASKHFASMVGHDPSPQWTVPRQQCRHTRHQAKERFLSPFSLHPIIKSELEKRHLKRNSLRGGSWLLFPEPGVSGFPSQKIKEDDRDDESKHFLIPFSEYFPKRLTFSSLHYC